MKEDTPTYLVAPELKNVFKILDFSLMDTYGFNREFFSEVIGDIIWNED